jgi:purine-binding chemotaxis protein CheW
MPRAEHTKNTRIVVTEIGGKRVGMVVDSVSEVLRLPLDAIEPAPDMITGADTEYIRGVGKIDDRLIILLDLAKIVTGSEKRELETADVEPAAVA